PDTLELGRFSGIIQDPAISKKQEILSYVKCFHLVCFEITDGRVYATSLGANWMMKGTEKIRKNNKIEIHDGETLTLMQASYFLKDLQYSKCLIETLSQGNYKHQSSVTGNQGFLPSFNNDDDREDSSDNGADIHDSDNSDSIKSIESDNKIISSESSYLGSSCESSESVIDD
ncbi:3678_t:CDS:2, partial [Cetraspora pellucida]